MTTGHDDLDDLKRLLADNPPPEADGSGRDRAAAAAMAAFDAEKTPVAVQGTRDRPRQRVRQSGLMTLIRSKLMTLTLSPMRMTMMGGASLAVMALALTAVPQMDLPRMDLPRIGPAAPQDTVTFNDPAVPADAVDTMLETTRQELAAVPTPTEPTRTAPARQAAPAPGPVPLAEQAQPVQPSAQADLAIAPAIGTLPSGDRAKARSKMARSGTAAAGCVGAGCTPGGSGLPVVVPLKAERQSVQDAEAPAHTYQEQGRDRFAEIETNPVQITAETPVSTFSIDVDTASYAFLRKALINGVLPPKDAVRIEEMINYFPYDYASPESRETPFATDVSVMPTPWNDGTKLMRIGIKGYALTPAEKPRSNLVFLLDTSGSMNAPDKLPLLINSFRLLVESLDADDTVSIVVYAGSAGTVLEPTKVSDKAEILAALDRLRAGGSTAGGEGIRQAYRLAEQNFDKDGVNRVILATDGDFNVGITDPAELEGFIERKRDTGVYLSVLGFGRGNYNDALMQRLAQNGNGQAAYIDTLNEARKTLVEEASSTLFPIAQDVKIQVEFNPATVAEYRLIGYETRLLAREDFNNDKIDAGEIGAGHTVTALYEITPVGSAARQVDDLRYGARETPLGVVPTRGEEYAFVKLRYKRPGEDASQLITRPVNPTFDTVQDDDARFASAVAAFGQILRGGRHTRDFSYDDVIALANGAKGNDPFGYRAEFVTLVRLAKSAAALERQR